jgi:hypothetical protein
MVTVGTGGSRHLRVTFTAELARRWGIHRCRYAAVAPAPAQRAVEFTISNEPLRFGHSFGLGFNGGASKRKNSPSRTMYVLAEEVPMLRRGRYLPEVEMRDGAIVVTVRADGESGPR